MNDDIGAYYERCAIERKAIVRAFARVRAIAGEDPTAFALLVAMRAVEDDAGNTGD